MQCVVIGGPEAQIGRVFEQHGPAVDRVTAEENPPGRWWVVAYVDESVTEALRAEGLDVTVTMDSKALEAQWATVRSQVESGDD
jgi:hypothetical protein